MGGREMDQDLVSFESRWGHDQNPAMTWPSPPVRTGPTPWDEISRL